jgi:hypothetical protein
MEDIRYPKQLLRYRPMGRRLCTTNKERQKQFVLKFSVKHIAKFIQTLKKTPKQDKKFKMKPQIAQENENITFMTDFWHKILRRFDVSLQGKSLDVSTTVSLKFGKGIRKHTV